MRSFYVVFRCRCHCSRWYVITLSYHYSITLICYYVIMLSLHHSKACMSWSDVLIVYVIQYYVSYIIAVWLAVYLIECKPFTLAVVVVECYFIHAMQYIASPRRVFYRSAMGERQGFSFRIHTHTHTRLDNRLAISQHRSMTHILRRRKVFRP